MRDEHDSWIKEAFGVDLGEALQRIKDEASALIDHIDKNPFDVDMQRRKIITDSLKHVVHSMS